MIERRIRLLLVAFILLLACGAARAIWLGSVKASSLRHAAVSQQTTEIVVPARRGSITDRNGAQLAVSEPAVAVAATPYLIKSPLSAANALSPIVGQPAVALLEKLSAKDTGFVYLARQLPAARARDIERLKIEGLQLLPESRRTYPRSWLATQLLGSVGTDAVGLGGLEYRYDRELRGQGGKRRLVKDARGDALSLRDVEPAVAGKDLRLTIDATLQGEVEEVLSTVGELWRPRGATALVMDPRDSSLLAVANWPRVDAGDLDGAPDYARQERSTGYGYEPGSTFKAITVAGALADRVATPDTAFDLPPKIQVADRVIGEAHARGPVRLTTSLILAQSSNVGAVKVGALLGKERFGAWVSRFGFGRPTGVDIPGEARGIVPRVDRYSGSSMGNLPIGQGLSVTPMQVAAAYAAIANGGTLRAPHVVQAIGGRRVAVPRGHRVISPQVADQLRRMLEGVLAPGGTASEAAIPGYQLAGKTGTSEKPDAYGGYSKSKFIASFVGFAPALDPKLLVAVMVDEPQGEIYGAKVAAPAFQKIMQFALPYFRIPPSESP